jgi:hypothetical protein
MWLEQVHIIIIIMIIIIIIIVIIITKRGDSAVPVVAHTHSP